MNIPQYKCKENVPQCEPEIKSEFSFKYFVEWLKFVCLPIRKGISAEDFGKELEVGDCIMYALKKRIIGEKYGDNWHTHMPTFNFYRYTPFRKIELLQ